MFSRTLIALGLMLATACQATPPASASDPEVARALERKTDLYEFSYSYPAQAAAIPALAKLLDSDLAGSEAELARQTAEAKSDAERSGYPYRPHYLSVGWSVAADVPGWLSLGAAVETYSGGAHGNQGFDSLLWEKAANLRRAPTDLFRSEAALREAIRSDFCDALDKERAERRGEPIVRNDNDGIGFDACIDPLEGTILLEASGDEAFDGITVLVPPYLAGPYAEGSYVIELPITAAVRAAVKPRYAEAFAPDA